MKKRIKVEDGNETKYFDTWKEANEYSIHSNSNSHKFSFVDKPNGILIVIAVLIFVLTILSLVYYYG